VATARPVAERFYAAGFPHARERQVLQTGTLPAISVVSADVERQALQMGTSPAISGVPACVGIQRLPREKPTRNVQA